MSLSVNNPFLLPLNLKRYREARKEYQTRMTNSRPISTGSINPLATDVLKLQGKEKVALGNPVAIQ